MSLKGFLFFLLGFVLWSNPVLAYDLQTLPDLDSTYTERIVFKGDNNVDVAIDVNQTSTNYCTSWNWEGVDATNAFFLAGSSGSPFLFSCYSSMGRIYSWVNNEWSDASYFTTMASAYGFTGYLSKIDTNIGNVVFGNSLPVKTISGAYPFSYYGYTDAPNGTLLKASSFLGYGGIDIDIDSTDIYHSSSDLSFNMQELGYNYKFIPVSPKYFILNDKFTYYFTPDNDYDVTFKINTNYSVVNYRFVLEKDGVQIDDFTFLIDGNSTNGFLSFNRGLEQIQLNLDSFSLYRLKFYADDSTDISASTYFEVKSGADDLLQNWYLEVNENADPDIEDTCAMLGDGFSYKFCKIIIPPSNYFSLKFNSIWIQINNKFVFIGQIYSALAIFYSSLNHTDIYPDPINLTFGSFDVGFIDFSDFALVFSFVRMILACTLWFVTIKYAFNKFSNIF